MWVVSIGSGMLVVGMTSLLYMDRLWPHMLMSSMMAGMICMLLCITFVLSRPFNGPLALQPDACWRRRYGRGDPGRPRLILLLPGPT